MMGHRQVEQAALFYEFSLERHIPADHWLRSQWQLKRVREAASPLDLKLLSAFFNGIDPKRTSQC